MSKRKITCPECGAIVKLGLDGETIVATTVESGKKNNLNRLRQMIEDGEDEQEQSEPKDKGNEKKKKDRDEDEDEDEDD